MIKIILQKERFSYRWFTIVVDILIRCFYELWMAGLFGAPANIASELTINARLACSHLAIIRHTNTTGDILFVQYFRGVNCYRWYAFIPGNHCNLSIIFCVNEDWLKLRQKCSHRPCHQKLELKHVSHIEIITSSFGLLFTTRMSFFVFQTILGSSNWD